MMISGSTTRRSYRAKFVFFIALMLLCFMAEGEYYHGRSLKGKHGGDGKSKKSKQVDASEGSSDGGDSKGKKNKSKGSSSDDDGESKGSSSSKHGGSKGSSSSDDGGSKSSKSTDDSGGKGSSSSSSDGGDSGKSKGSHKGSSRHKSSSADGGHQKGSLEGISDGTSDGGSDGSSDSGSDSTSDGESSGNGKGSSKDGKKGSSTSGKSKKGGKGESDGASEGGASGAATDSAPSEGGAGAATDSAPSEGAADAGSDGAAGKGGKVGKGHKGAAASAGGADAVGGVTDSPSTGTADGAPSGAPGDDATTSPGAPTTVTGATPVSTPSGPSTVSNVLALGARDDGKTDNAEAFIKTWNKACKSPETTPATVLIPKGVFVTGPVIFQGPCTGSKHITLQVQGTIQATTDVSEYSEPEWISFENINNLLINGGGVFDGQGKSAWMYNDCAGKTTKCQLLPTSLKFKRVNNSVLQGFSSKDSKGFHITITFCDNLQAHELKITAPEESPNTDGIHVSLSNSVTVTNSVIGTGDDCISIGHGSTNIAVTKVTCGPGHGFSIGSLGKYPDEKDVSKILVQNCTARGTSNGVRIKTFPDCPPTSVSDVTFQDIILEGVNNSIIIDQNYGSKAVTKPPSRVKISNVHFRNIKGTSTRPEVVHVHCSSAFPCEGVELTGIDVVYRGTTSVSAPPFTCVNAKSAKIAAVTNPPGLKCS